MEKAEVGCDLPRQGELSPDSGADGLNPKAGVLWSSLDGQAKNNPPKSEFSLFGLYKTRGRFVEVC